MKIRSNFSSLIAAAKARAVLKASSPTNRVVLQVNGAIGALGQRFAQDLAGARRAGGNHHYFAGVLFLLPQRFFQRVRVGLIDLVGNVFADPGARLVQFEGRIFLRNLLHANQDFHE